MRQLRSFRIRVRRAVDIRYSPLDPPNPEVEPPPEPPEELVALGVETDWAADVGPVVIVPELAAVVAVVIPVDIERDRKRVKGNVDEKLIMLKFRSTCYWSKSINNVVIIL